MNRTTAALVTAGAVSALVIPGLSPAAAGGHHGPSYDEPRVVTALDGPRGVDALGHGRTLVTESDGSFSMVVERRHGPAKVIGLGALATDFPPAVALGRHGTVFLLTGASSGPPEDARAASVLTADEVEPEPAAGATLYRWRPGWDAPRPFADIGAYQVGDPDPADLEDLPADSNPFGLAALADGSVLVADAAGNDLLRVDKHGDITTVARLLPRVVEVPEGLPELPPEAGGPLPPAGTPIPSEAVATSVTVGPDGAWYVGELRGFPATPGTSQVWRIKPGTVGATCDPEAPWTGRCTRYADGLTSVVDLAAGSRGVYALELSKQSWFATELGLPGSEIGGLYLIGKHRHGTRLHELATDRLLTPGGVDVVGRDVYVTGPLFGPGALLRVG
ncbi:ScyD/ScyE family protein [Nocardioides plantarum]|uniref:ScyD/ScyE family protein n=1 Tax=Nocardioides plantarum TaxID=29299 RepID=A0ABV5KB56_9ACTN|nr:ScyD/ScyE family protein [Nocardioides plantarum]